MVAIDLFISMRRLAGLLQNLSYGGVKPVRRHPVGMLTWWLWCGMLTGLLGVHREQLDGEFWLITDVIALERDVGTAWLGELAWMCEGASAPSPFRAHRCVSSARSTVGGLKAGDGRRKLFNGLELGPWSPWCDLLLFIFSHLLSMILGR